MVGGWGKEKRHWHHESKKRRDLDYKEVGQRKHSNFLWVHWKVMRYVILWNPFEVKKNVFSLKVHSLICAWLTTVSPSRTLHGATVLLRFCFESFIVKYMSNASFAVKSILLWHLINDHFDHLWQVAKNLCSLPLYF